MNFKSLLLLTTFIFLKSSILTAMEEKSYNADSLYEPADELEAKNTLELIIKTFKLNSVEPEFSEVSKKKLKETFDKTVLATTPDQTEQLFEGIFGHNHPHHDERAPSMIPLPYALNNPKPLLTAQQLSLRLLGRNNAIQNLNVPIEQDADLSSDDTFSLGHSAKEDLAIFLAEQKSNGYEKKD